MIVARESDLTDPLLYISSGAPALRAVALPLHFSRLLLLGPFALAPLVPACLLSFDARLPACAIEAGPHLAVPGPHCSGKIFPTGPAAEPPRPFLGLHLLHLLLTYFACCGVGGHGEHLGLEILQGLHLLAAAAQ